MSGKIEGKKEYARRCSLKVPSHLTDAELNEDVVRKLVWKDTLASTAENVFILHRMGHTMSSSDFKIKGQSNLSPCVNLIHVASAAVHKDSPEFAECAETVQLLEWTTAKLDELSSQEDSLACHSEISDGSKTISNSYNQFVAMDTDTQTGYLAMENQETQTKEPPVHGFSMQISKSIMYDAYADEVKVKMGPASKTHDEHQTSGSKEIDWHKVLVKAQLMERYVSHNIFKDLDMKYHYYEDPSDDGGPRAGNLMPLWEFTLLGVEMPLTDLHWIRTKPELLAATYGSYEFLVKDSTGVLAIWCLKNALYPEYLYTTPAPAQCVAMHPHYFWIAAVGLHDGHVAVYDILTRCKEPELKSDSTNKHDSAVQAIRWKDDDDKKELAFYTIACDGVVKGWLLRKTRLDATIIFSIPMNRRICTDEGVLLDIKGSGFRLEFHPSNKHTYLVGTRRGQIFQCNTDITVASVFQYNGHDTVNLSVQYNTFYPKVFLSCSADWRVIIWEEGLSEPLLEFNLERQVTDAKWSPYSSTVFAACTIDGTVHLFDLQVDRNTAVLKQKVIADASIDHQPTRIAFKAAEPYLLVVGDRKGRIQSFKISRHLRIPTKASKKDTQDPTQLEINKLMKVLSFMKPKTLEYPPDESCNPPQ